MLFDDYSVVSAFIAILSRVHLRDRRDGFDQHFIHRLEGMLLKRHG